ncbi:MAG: class I SAM-dependent methyltransferase [Planctomycetota bacterium]|jgi:hypothetical protein
MFDMGLQPMSLVALQSDMMKSFCLERHPINLSICHHCTHVHNTLFNPHHARYDAAGCRMYNSGADWQKHMDEVREMLPLPLVDLVIDVGAGDCEFLASLRRDPRLQFAADLLAVDPCEAVEQAGDWCAGIEFVRDYFDPAMHIPRDAGTTLITMRHLLEHVEYPRELLEPIANAAQRRTVQTFIYLEVPSCENALRRCRIEDWTYEHPQHFTVKSMRALLHNCGLDHFVILPKYGGEVLSVLVKIEPEPLHDNDLSVPCILQDYRQAANNIDREAGWFRRHAQQVAFWGGAGKSAMFLRRFSVPQTATVVDSHGAKVGMYVPGTRIEIQSPDVLKQNPVDYIVATTSWRAGDIANEIIERGILCKALLKFENGELVEVPLGN